MAKNIRLIVIFIGIALNLSCQNKAEPDYLIRIADPVSDTYGYKNISGDTIIPMGRYLLCFTDTFRTFAIVHKAYKGFVAIDRKENELYTVFASDNGPDSPSEGLFRIIGGSNRRKIGYADLSTGKVVIKPQFSCAFPFENGLAKVSDDCTTEPSGEYQRWVSDSWYYIDRTGKKVATAVE